VKVKTKVKAGGITFNHNETMVKTKKKSLKVKTKVRSGGLTLNHNETMLK
jgi:hypothetical protein